MYAQSRAFEDVVAELLSANGFADLHRPPGEAGPPVFDFIASLADTRWAVEVIYYRTETAQPMLIYSAARALLEAASKRQLSRAMLVLSCTLDPQLRERLEHDFPVVFVDRIDLSIMSGKAPEVRGRLEALRASAVVPMSRKKWEARKASVIKLQTPPPPRQRAGEDLCKTLKGLKKGKKQWKAHESLCIEILRFLFPDDLTAHSPQRVTEDGLNRFDLICRLTPTTAFWRFVDERLASSYVLFEFKNYTAKIAPREILSTEKYLLPRVLRSVAIVLTREGATEQAKMMAMGAMREAGKVILILSDEELCRMLHAKDRGEDPSDLLFDTTDKFLMTMNR